MKTVNLLTGRTGRHPAAQVSIFPQLEQLPDDVTVVHGGDAELSDGVDFIFTTSTDADALVFRGNLA